MHRESIGASVFQVLRAPDKHSDGLRGLFHASLGQPFW
jgi:hypothetical protein